MVHCPADRHQQNLIDGSAGGRVQWALHPGGLMHNNIMFPTTERDLTVYVNVRRPARDFGPTLYDIGGRATQPEPVMPRHWHVR